MAYAGTFKINTQFETRDANSQILRLCNEIKKTETEISRMQAKMESMKEAKVPTYEYQEMQKELQKAEANADKLYGKMRLLEKSGDTSSKGYRKLVNEISLADQQVNYLRDGLSGLESAGKAFVPGSMSTEFEKTSQKVDELNGKLEESKAKLNEMLKKQGSTKEIFSRMQKAASRLLPTIKNVEQKFSNAFSKIRSAAVKTFSSINKQGKKTGGLMSTLASRFKGIALSLLIFNWITKGFNAMVSGAKAGLKNLQKYSEEYKQSIRDLQNALGTLKNSFAAAFAPIIQAVVPYLIELINWVNRAVNALEQLFAYMTGHATWKKAVEVQDAYKDALNGTAGAAKKAAGALAKFDDLDVLNKNTGGGGGGGSTGGFEEVPIDSGIKSFWDKIKKMWQDADFYDLGKMLAEKINDMLESIDWSEVRETARKLGKSLATFLNGILENLDWNLLGVTIAQGINTAFEFAYGFVKNFNWKKFGEAIAEAINGFMGGLDWGLISDTIITGCRGVATSVMGFVRTLKWEQLAQTIANGINVAVDGLIALLYGIKWGEIGHKIGKFLIDTINDIDWEDIGRVLGKILQSAFDFLAGIINEMDYESIKKAISDFFEGFGKETKDIPDWVFNLAEAFIAFKLALAGLDAVIAGSKIIDFLSKLNALFPAMQGAFSLNGALVGGGATIGFFDALKHGDNLKEFETATSEISESIKKLNDDLDAGRISVELYQVKMKKLEDASRDAASSLYGLNPDNYNEDGWNVKLEPAIEKIKELREESNNFVLGDELGKYFNDTIWNWDVAGAFGKIKEDVAASLEKIKESFIGGWKSLDEWWKENAPLRDLPDWWDTYVAPWFTQEKWVELFSNIGLAFETKWNEITDWWQNTALYTWWEENVVPWFTQEKWSELIENIKTAFTEKWEEIKEKTTELLEELKKSIIEKYDEIKLKTDELKENFDKFKEKVSSTFSAIKSKIIDEALSPIIEKLKEFIDWVKSAIQAVKDFFNSGYERVGTTTGKTSKASPSTRSINPAAASTVLESVPHLASGSVIRGGNPFLAMLGDQPRGQVNVEAPAGLIKDMVKAGLAESGYGQERLPVNINLIYDGEAFARLSISDILSEMNRRGLDIEVLGAT